MHSKSRSAKVDFDYKRYNKTGEKVPINRFADQSSGFKKMSKLKVEEAKCVNNASLFFQINELEDINDVDELDDYIAELSKLGKTYGDIHSELALELDSDTYGTEYPNHDEFMKKIILYLKTAKSKIRNAKITKKSSEYSEIENALLIEEKCLKCEIQHYLDKLNIDAIHDIHEMGNVTTCLNMHSSNLMKLRCKMEVVFAENDDFLEALNVIELKLSEMLEKCNRKLNDTRSNLEKLKLDKTIADEKNVRLAIENELKERTIWTDHSRKEIDLRCKGFKSKISIAVSELNDHQLLDMNRRLFEYDKEFNEILGKITLFSKCAVGSDISAILEKIAVERDTISKLKEKFFKSVQEAILNRDLSEEKLKNAVSLKIKLPKFDGYDSVLDIYTFKKEFEKIVEPSIQKKLWSDCLKHNYLSGQALTLVENLDEIDEIWTRLTSTFGDVQLLLQNKLCSLDKIGGLWKTKSDETLMNLISTLLNKMSDLANLAKKYNLENELYYGGGIDKILCLMGDSRKRKFIRKNTGNKLKGPDAWKNVMDMLNKELAECEKLTLYMKSEQCLSKVNKDVMDSHNVDSNGENLSCFICGKNDHAVSHQGSSYKSIQYFSCKLFVNSKPGERLKLLRDKGLCTKCLRPGMESGHKGVCYYQYCCPSESHSGIDKLHVLLCETHCINSENKQLLERYKTQIMERLCPSMDSFSKGLNICNYTAEINSPRHGFPSSGELGRGIFKLQTISINGVEFNLFYDGGCSDLVCRKSAIDKLITLGRAEQELPGPYELRGVGDVKQVCEYGIFQIRLPLADGGDAVMSGLCMDKVTGTLPEFQLREAEKDIHSECSKKKKHILGKVPKLPDKVGGDTDIMIGTQYLKYFPNIVFKIKSTGLSLYKSRFKSSDGTRGVLGGPHKSFDQVTYPKSQFGLGVYCFKEVEIYWNRFSSGLNVPLLGDTEIRVNDAEMCACDVDLMDDGNEECYAVRQPKSIKVHEHIIIQEEVEQSLIMRSVGVDTERGITTVVRLKSNIAVATKAFALLFMLCIYVAIYAMFDLRNGSHSGQLVFSRSVIEINRLTDMERWRYVQSKDMIAYIGTRKGATIKDIGPDSEWINGKPWMGKSEFPVKTVKEICLSQTEMNGIDKESINPNLVGAITYHVGLNCMFNGPESSEVEKRYRFRKVVRILALGMLFLKNCIKKLLKVRKKLKHLLNSQHEFNVPKHFSCEVIRCDPGNVVCLLDDEINDALVCYFLKLTVEVKKFVIPRKYCDITSEVNGIPFCNSRILPSEKFGHATDLSDVAFDSTCSTFCVPELANRTTWLKSDENFVWFLKVDNKFEQQYQFGIVKDIYESRDGHVRKVTVEYQNHNEKTKRTQRGVRELAVILPVEELSIDEMLGQVASSCSH